MQMTATKSDPGNSLLKLPEILDMSAADSCLASVRECLKNGGTLCIDASAVETLTLPCAQIIVAAALSHGRPSIVNPSVAFISAFEDLGIDLLKYLDLTQMPMPTNDQEPAPHVDNNQPQATGGSEMQSESPQPGMQEMERGAMNTRILTIDDSKTMRDMLMLTLADAGFDVVQAVDGQDGLDVLKKEKVDVIITDINMPRMDGYEVIRQLRGVPEYKTMPILVLTTESEAQKKNIAREAGATGWLVKPFDPEQLVATVRKVAPLVSQF